MDKETLIESGLVELYSIGAANEQEQLLVEEQLHDADVRSYLSSVESNLEKSGIENAKTPPAWVKNNVMNAIGVPTEVEKLSSKGSTISIVERQLESWRKRFMVAASLAALMALAFGWQLFSNGGKSAQRAEAVTEQLNELQAQVSDLRSSNDLISSRLTYINHTYTTPIVLKGTTVAPDSKAVVYWNPTVDQALLSTNGLPELPEGKVYQIWADVEGEMVSMKVFEATEKLVQLPFMKQAESLNITVEPKGGSDHPNVEQLYVNGLTDI